MGMPVRRMIPTIRPPMINGEGYKKHFVDSMLLEAERSANKLRSMINDLRKSWYANNKRDEKTVILATRKIREVFVNTKANLEHSDRKVVDIFRTNLKEADMQDIEPQVGDDRKKEDEKVLNKSSTVDDIQIETVESVPDLPFTLEGDAAKDNKGDHDKPEEVDGIHDMSIEELEEGSAKENGVENNEDEKDITENKAADSEVKENDTDKSKDDTSADENAKEKSELDSDATNSEDNSKNNSADDKAEQSTDNTEVDNEKDKTDNMEMNSAADLPGDSNDDKNSNEQTDDDTKEDDQKTEDQDNVSSESVGNNSTNANFDVEMDIVSKPDDDESMKDVDDNEKDLEKEVDPSDAVQSENMNGDVDQNSKANDKSDDTQNGQVDEPIAASESDKSKIDGDEPQEENVEPVANLSDENKENLSKPDKSD